MLDDFTPDHFVPSFPEASRPTASSPRPVVLVCENDPDVRRFLADFLVHEGCEAVVARHGREVLELVAVAAPDLVLLDADMPEMNSFETCRQLKESARTALVPITMLTSGSSPERRRHAIEAGADDFLHKPIDAATLRARIHTQLRIKRMTDQLERTETVMFAMARWVELKDHYTEGHLRRVAGYSERTARACGLSGGDLLTVRSAGILHDIGKIAVPDAILSKAGPLTPEERAILERHSEHGAEIVAPLRFSASVGPIVRSHHERWDGRGYPQRLAGDAIPLGARVIAVVDTWDAMTTDRPYRRALDVLESSRRLREAAGTQLDARIVDIFLELHNRGELAPMELENLLPAGDSAFPLPRAA